MSKKFQIALIIILVAIAGIWSFRYFSNDADVQNKISNKKTENKTYWTCPMHPQVHLEHPGNCPICGMTLVEVKSQESQVEMKESESQRSENMSDKMMKEDANKPYWTCPMHPQVHSDHQGECPICHMKLVLEKSPPSPKTADEKRAAIKATDDQLKLAGIQKQEVETMTLKISIPVSGRFISSSKVAFQIYESDLRYVKTGLSFTGESSFYPEKKVSGTISSIDSIVDPTSRTVRVIGSIKNGLNNIASETGFRGNIEFDLTNRIAIPESSVLHTGNGDLVYLFSDDEKLTPKTVKLGLKSEGFYDVLDGLKSGQMISSGPNFLIDSEAKIRGTSEPSQMQMHQHD
jgi:Cu(I)/Ag(I) efflux system membrane fusion protein